MYFLLFFSIVIFFHLFFPTISQKQQDNEETQHNSLIQSGTLAHKKGFDCRFLFNGLSIEELVIHNFVAITTLLHT